jgi:integrase
MGILKKGENWYIDYYCGNHRKREKIGPSKSLAREVLLKRQSQVSENKFFPERLKSSIAFAQAVEKYWKLEGRYLKAKGGRAVFKALESRFSDKKLAEVSVANLQEFYNEKAEATSASTANRILAFLSPVFNRAKEWGDFFGDNPTEKVRRRKPNNHRLRFLSEVEIKELLNVAETRIRPVLVCAILTGMRKGEILGLRWENVDLEHDTIFILQSKSGKPREIPMGKKLKDVFLALKPNPAGSVFNIPEITLRRQFARALKNGKIQEFRFHDLRHTFASHFVMRTGDLPTLQKILGHSSPQMTQRYAHLAKEHLAEKMDKFDSSMPVESIDLPQDGHFLDTKLKIETQKTVKNAYN